MMLNLVAGVFVALTVTLRMAAAQAEPCTLKQHSAECLRGSECCSRCCVAGLCSTEGSCFPACNSSTAATAEGPALCRLTKSIDELADVVKTIINDDLATGVPVLAHILRSVTLFFKNPMAGFVMFADVIKDVQTLGHVFNTTAEETKHILGDVSDIIDTTINLISKIVNSQ